MEFLSDKKIAFNKEEKVRCDCNKLLCVTKGNDIEIKCNKCKRIIVIKTNGIISINIQKDN